MQNRRQGATRSLTTEAIEAFIVARSDSTVTNLLAQGVSEPGSCQRERFSLEPPGSLVCFFSLAERFSASFTYAWNWRRDRWENSLHWSLAKHMAGRQDIQRECGSKASPGNHLLHPAQLQVAMVTQEVEMEAARKRTPKKAGRSKKRHSSSKKSEESNDHICQTKNPIVLSGLIFIGTNACTI
ncbi:hypothetical protein E2C01_043750 [Portunus trituberculatus]|uniref:Uncharacterized protein n=1 Tax=Portunus trituberculatus TaxID=210409 RepID=A0A5B7FWI7_PORTR|nr:hypothetical protein [Portunus trituberculatus]